MVRNAQPAVAHWGGLLGTLYAGFDMWLRAADCAAVDAQAQRRSHDG